MSLFWIKPHFVCFFSVGFMHKRSITKKNNPPVWIFKIPPCSTTGCSPDVVNHLPCFCISKSLKQRFYYLHGAGFRSLWGGGVSLQVNVPPGCEGSCFCLTGCLLGKTSAVHLQLYNTSLLESLHTPAERAAPGPAAHKRDVSLTYWPLYARRVGACFCIRPLPPTPPPFEPQQFSGLHLAYFMLDFIFLCTFAEKPLDLLWQFTPEIVFATVRTGRDASS